MQYVHVPPCDREAGCIPQGMGQQALCHVNTHSDSLSNTITVPLQMWELISQEGKGRRAKDPPILLHVQYPFTLLSGFFFASNWQPLSPVPLSHTATPDCLTQLLFSLRNTRSTR